MDLLEALKATRPDKGPQSFLEKYLEHLETTGDRLLSEVMAELSGSRQAAWVGRALTVMARSAGVIDDSSTISGQSVTKWRDTHGTR